MIVINSSNTKVLESNNYVALGSFDGFHLGHMSLLNEAIELAKKNNGKSMVFTFSNHPLTLIKPEKAPKILMTLDEKEKFLENKNIDILVLQEFNDSFMKQTPEEFIEYLVKEYNVKGIVVGFNYKFGHKNLGDINLLKELKSKFGYELVIKDSYNFKDNTISSTRIRKAIAEGEIKEANVMLGENYKLTGTVVHGKKLGRTIGFPTANIEYQKNKLVPKNGVYYTNVTWNNKKYKGITNIGYIPTVNGNKLNIETFIIDFSNEIYGDSITIEFIERIRDEKKFNSIDDLVNQLDKDKSYAINKL